MLILSACQGLAPAWALPEHRREAARLEIQHGLPTGLLSGICEVESHWMHPTPNGQHGEHGLCQLKPNTVLTMCTGCYVEPVGNLHQGHRSKYVRELQEALKRAGYSPGTIDGVFGLKTHIAVTLFQESRGLVPDGIVGRKTSKALGLTFLPSLEDALADPYKNLEFAARHLVWLRNHLKIDDPDILAAAYNGGPKSAAVAYMLKVRRANE
jgi:hypothetical protein